MMEKLKEYILKLDEIENLLFDLPGLNYDLEYDLEIEKFFDRTFERVHNHKIIMLNRLRKEEKEKWQQLQQIKAHFI